MPLSVTVLASTVGSRIVLETAASATADVNVVNGPATVFMVDVDNSANGAPTYLKLYNLASPVVGTDPPIMIVPVAATVRRAVAIPEGLSFSVGVSFAATAQPAQNNTTNPSAAVVVRLVTS